MSHRNARLTVHGRRLLVQRVAAGRPEAHMAVEMGVSWATGYTWVNRWRTEGEARLADRSSRPHATPHRTPPETEAAVVTLRTEHKLGPTRIGPILCLAPSTVHRVPARHRLHHLAWLDRPTGQVIRRYERDRPGELIHADVKKPGRIPDSGGWKVTGRAPGTPRHRGHGYIHSAIDDHSRLA